MTEEKETMNAQKIATSNSIMRCLVGSKLHGLNVPGQDDRDEMGLCIEPPSHVVGLSKFEHWVYRTAAEGQRSGPDDLDLTIYSLRKWVRLALNGNPTVLTLMFAPKAEAMIWSPIADDIQSILPELIVARSSGRAFLGYLTQQRQRLERIRGGRRKPNRPELIKAYGFDTKYAMHVCRLGHQGRELLQTGRITLPMPELQRKFCFDVRTGKIPLADVLHEADILQADIAKLIEDGPLQERPNTEAVNEWLVDTYQGYWNTSGVFCHGLD